MTATTREPTDPSIELRDGDLDVDEDEGLTIATAVVHARGDE